MHNDVLLLFEELHLFSAVVIFKKVLDVARTCCYSNGNNKTVLEETCSLKFCSLYNILLASS